MLPAQPDRLLVVEDRANLSTSLARHGYRVDTAGDARLAMEKIRRASYDLVLLDKAGAGSGRLDLLRLLRATHSPDDLPVILVTGAGEHQTAVEALHGGANDFVVHPVDLPVVTARIEQQLSRLRPRRKRHGRAPRSRESEPGRLEIDPLTALASRRVIVERLRELSTEKVEAPITLLVLDLDGFRIINNSFGEGTADRILIEVGRRIRVAVGDSERVRVARLGGDEFAILAEGMREAAALAKAILESVVHPMEIGELAISAGASIGVLCSFAAASSPDDLLRDAHLAMYRAKELGKNRWHVFEPELRTRARARMALIHDLRYALERNELRAFYQPKVNLRTRQIVGFEALIRWRHPERGLVYPGDFIELAEETGMIVPIGEWILAEACRQLRTWQTRFDAGLRMNVNLSVKELLDPNLVSRVGAILGNSGLAPDSLNLELTETALMTNLPSARHAMSRLRELGVGLKLDDFGTGYSSLGYLRAMQFDSLKIDKSFVMRMNSDRESRAIVESMTRLARALEMTVVAEGVELEAHIEELLKLGCEVGQGFYFSAAVEAEQAENLLEASMRRPIFAASRYTPDEPEKR